MKYPSISSLVRNEVFKRYIYKSTHEVGGVLLYSGLMVNQNFEDVCVRYVGGDAKSPSSFSIN